MPNNNPAGANGTSYFEGFADETPYGAVKRLTQLTQAAPPARPRKQQQPPPPVPVVEQLQAAPPPPAAIWREVMGVPGIRADLVERWAQDA